MNAFAASARHEALNIRRSRTAHILLWVFVGMVLVSSLIGWITNRTVTGVFDRIRAEGLTSQPNPFTGVSPLTYERNTVIYVLLIGALMAVVLGAQASLRDRKSGTSALVLSRPVGTASRLLGQLAGIGAVLGVVLGGSVGASWVVLGIIDAAPLGPEHTLRLLAFAALSWVLLMAFAVLGMLTGLVSRSETTALLVSFVLWSAIAFVVPQLGTAARPVTLLGPVPHPAATGGWFDAVAAVTGPLAVTEQYKRAAGVLLQDRNAQAGDWTGALVVAAALLILVLVLAVTPRRRLRRPLDE
ncbi:ABC transporter permease [Naasia sp. SYSU D00057]|uniref:ABC transporter permease n=1 Tax=Naasia sp. SYSU D00057 TaxID=2817380 RepID=UPI001B3174B4|nr:ABC transporter permease [Naasia sp. SYSU D00057]